MAMKGISVLFFVVLVSVKSDDGLDHLNKENVLPMNENDSAVTATGADEEYFRQIYSLIAGYRSDVLGGRFTIETNALINTKYKTWKRNADIINSLLALPKGMNDAGR